MTVSTSITFESQGSLITSRHTTIGLALLITHDVGGAGLWGWHIGHGQGQFWGHTVLGLGLQRLRRLETGQRKAGRRQGGMSESALSEGTRHASGVAVDRCA
eukprot:scaffold4431_cov111-Isochrysis_galbana.AAC.4